MFHCIPHPWNLIKNYFHNKNSKNCLNRGTKHQSVSNNCAYAESRITYEEISSNEKYYKVFCIGLYMYAYIWVCYVFMLIFVIHILQHIYEEFNSETLALMCQIITIKTYIISYSFSLRIFRLVILFSFFKNIWKVLFFDIWESMYKF